MALSKRLLWGRAQSYSDVGLRLLLVLVLAALAWLAVGPAIAIPFAFATAFWAVLTDLRHVRHARFGPPPPAWPTETVPPGRGD
jgi:hypothetical protein